MTVTVLMATLARPGWDVHLPELLDQTTPPDQLLVVIDRVTDDGERADLRARWPQVEFIFNDTNIGLTRSLNRGLAAATGDYVFRADDDDGYRHDRIEKQLALLLGGQADLVLSWAEGVTGGAGATPYLIRCPTDDKAIRAALRRRNVLVHASLAFRRDKIMAFGGYDETFLNAQDYALYLAAIRAGLRFAAVPEPLVRRSYTGDSITVGRRYHQLMYSCAARVVHHAYSGDRRAFVATLIDYARLAAVPAWARRLRRRAHMIMGRGV